MQYLKFFDFLTKTWTIMCNFLNLFPISKNVDYHIKFLNFLTKTCNIIFNFWNFFPCSKNVDYHMQFLKFLSLLQKRGLSYAISEFPSLLQKRGLSYAFYGISFPSPKTWTIICILWNFFPSSKNMDNHMQYLKFFYFLTKTWTIILNSLNFFPFSKNMDYHMQ